MSTRRAGKLCHKSSSTGKRALDRLVALGFIKVRRNYSFQNKRKAREYELTAISMKQTSWTSELPNGSKPFMSLNPNHIKQIDAGELKLSDIVKTKHSVTSDGDSATSEDTSDNVVSLCA